MDNKLVIALLLLLSLCAGLFVGSAYFPKTEIVEVDKIVEVPVEKIVEKVVEIEKPVYRYKIVKAQCGDDSDKVYVELGNSVVEEQDIAEPVQSDAMVQMCNRFGYETYVSKEGVNGNYMCENQYNGFWNDQYDICCVSP